MKVYLVNAGPQRTPFTCQIMQISEDEGEFADLKSPKESAIESMRSVMQVTPTTGILEPWS
jgi:hypothetical protein